MNVACMRACLSPFDIKGCHTTLVHTANVIENMEKAYSHAERTGYVLFRALVLFVYVYIKGALKRKSTRTSTHYVTRHAPEAMRHTPQVCTCCLAPGFEPSLRPFVTFALVAARSSAQKVASSKN